jgi:hypothetical protein
MLALRFGLHLKQTQVRVRVRVKVNRQLAPPLESTFSRHPIVVHTNNGHRH